MEELLTAYLFNSTIKEIITYQAFVNSKQNLLSKITNLFNRNKIEFCEDEYNQKAKIFFPIINELNKNIIVRNVYNENKILLKKGLEPKIKFIKI